VAAPGRMLLCGFRATIHACSFIPTLTIPPQGGEPEWETPFSSSEE